MAKRKTATSPPPTEVLSETRREVSADDLTPSQGEFAGSPNPEPDTGGVIQEPPVYREPLDQPEFTVDESGQEPGVPSEEPTEEPEEDKRLRDAQSAFHQSRQENAELKKMIQAIVSAQQLTGGVPQSPMAANTPPAEFFQQGPTQEEMQDARYPMNYVERRLAAERYIREREEQEREMENFLHDNPDWADLLPTMQQLRTEDPFGYYGRGAFRRLHRHAKDRKELEGHRQKQQQIADQSLAAGAQMAKNRGGQAFVPPKSGGTGGGAPRTGPPTPPADFGTWDTEDQKKWLIANGRYKFD